MIDDKIYLGGECMDKDRLVEYLKSPVINLDTPEKAQKFYDYLINYNPENEKIKKMIKESPSIPRKGNE